MAKSPRAPISKSSKKSLSSPEVVVASRNAIYIDITDDDMGYVVKEMSREYAPLFIDMLSEIRAELVRRSEPSERPANVLPMKRGSTFL